MFFAKNYWKVILVGNVIEGGRARAGGWLGAGGGYKGVTYRQLYKMTTFIEIIIALFSIYSLLALFMGRFWGPILGADFGDHGEHTHYT